MGDDAKKSAEGHDLRCWDVSFEAVLEDGCFSAVRDSPDARDHDGVNQEIQNDSHETEIGSERQGRNYCKYVANGSKMGIGQKRRAAEAQKIPGSIDSLPDSTSQERHGRGGLSDCDRDVRESRETY